MKYFVIADVHGFYKEMIHALNEAGFDPNNENHTLISCGDVIDRGPDSTKIIKYLINLPRKILIRGNHEDLLNELMNRPYGPYYYDITNGTYDTFIQIASKYTNEHYGFKITRSSMQHFDFDDVRRHALSETDYQTYDSLLVDYFETDNYVFVHGFIPTIRDSFTGEETVITNWRQKATIKNWHEARWTHNIGANFKFKIKDDMNKKIVCGHIHSYYGNVRKKYGWDITREKENEIINKNIKLKNRYKEYDKDLFKIYENDDLICLDSLTVLTKIVNVFVFED